MAQVAITKNLGLLLLSIYLIFTGLAILLSFTFNGMHIVQGGLALAAGILILIGR